MTGQNNSTLHSSTAPLSSGKLRHIHFHSARMDQALQRSDTSARFKCLLLAEEVTALPLSPHVISLSSSAAAAAPGCSGGTETPLESQLLHFHALLLTCVPVSSSVPLCSSAAQSSCTACALLSQ
ncbi:unnamed protein product [Pleuronectes platessa]|uniref:Uncharacterized protein n=1 Tax=Pleuronectes platessa TaxID=8262 RepID=A0A9N7W4E3_PLEPL|nr:unnamed protein product [Pleuronectes platessa]